MSSDSLLIVATNHDKLLDSELVLSSMEKI